MFRIDFEWFNCDKLDDFIMHFVLFSDFIIWIKEIKLKFNTLFG